MDTPKPFSNKPPVSPSAEEPKSAPKKSEPYKQPEQEETTAISPEVRKILEAIDAEKPQKSNPVTGARSLVSDTFATRRNYVRRRSKESLKANIIKPAPEKPAEKASAWKKLSDVFKKFFR